MENHQKLGLFLQRSIKLPDNVKFASNDKGITWLDPYDKDAITFYIYLVYHPSPLQTLTDNWDGKILQYGIALTALEPVHEVVKKVQEAANDFSRKLNDPKLAR